MTARKRQRRGTEHGCPSALSSVEEFRTIWPGVGIQRFNFQPAPTRELNGDQPVSRNSGITLIFKTTLEVFTGVSPDNSLERLTERSVGLVTDRPSDVDELFVTLL